MSKVFFATICVFAGFVLAVLILGLPPIVRAGGGAPTCSSQSGDVNADGKIDLTDAVTILGHLFQGNPTQLLPLCAPPPAPSSLPDTGQTKCYDQAGTEVPCDNATCPGQDAFYQTGCPSQGRFIDNGDTVTDTCTGLMWQKNTADINGDGQLNRQDLLNWCQAIEYCENLSFAGHHDWRLPNILELQSIVDYGRFNPSIDPVFGAFSDDNGTSDNWSSTTLATNLGYAWIVGFYGGGVAGCDKVLCVHYVRAVRNAP